MGSRRRCINRHILLLILVDGDCPIRRLRRKQRSPLINIFITLCGLLFNITAVAGAHCVGHKYTAPFVARQLQKVLDSRIALETGSGSFPRHDSGGYCIEMGEGLTLALKRQSARSRLRGVTVAVVILSGRTMKQTPIDVLVRPLA